MNRAGGAITNSSGPYMIFQRAGSADSVPVGGYIPPCRGRIVCSWVRLPDAQWAPFQPASGPAAPLRRPLGERPDSPSDPSGLRRASPSTCQRMGLDAKRRETGKRRPIACGRRRSGPPTGTIMAPLRSGHSPIRCSDGKLPLLPPGPRSAHLPSIPQLSNRESVRRSPFWSRTVLPDQGPPGP